MEKPHPDAWKSVSVSRVNELVTLLTYETLLDCILDLLDLDLGEALDLEQML